ncbi:Actin-like protein 10 [Lobaria immixta]|nr:Actin-like protein 10 [Lobaria immixta]
MMLIGQALQHDLDFLRVIHTNIVDSAILTTITLEPESNMHWELEDWGKLKSEEGEKRLKERKKEKEKKEKEKKEKEKKEKEKKEKEKKEKEKKEKEKKEKEKNHDILADESQVTRWSEIAKDCGWPHPDNRI